MEANYVHKDSTTLVQDELVKNELNQIELQYNALKQQKFNELLKENKKLKEKVKKLSQWDINKDTRNSRQRVANAKLLKENQELKKQLEEYQQELEKADNLTQICIFKGKEESNISYRKCLNALDKKETQQKEFIKYLEDEIQKKREKATTLTSFTRNVVPLKHCLQKYKSIIGVSDEKKQI